MGNLLTKIKTLFSVNKDDDVQPVKNDFTSDVLSIPQTTWDIKPAISTTKLTWDPFWKSLLQQLNESTNFKNIWESISWFAKWFVSWRKIKKTNNQTLSELFNYKVINSSSRKSDLALSIFEKWAENNDWNIDTLKTNLKDAWINNRLIRKITPETVSVASSILWKKDTLIKDAYIQETTNLKNSITNNFDSVFRIPWMEYKNITSDDGVKLFKTIDGLSWDISDINIFKQQLVDNGVSKETISKITNDNIDKLQQQYKFTKNNHKIESIDNNGNITTSDGKLKTTIDKDWNIIEEIWETSDQENNLLKQENFTQISKDLIKEYLLNKLYKLYPDATWDEISAIYADVYKTIEKEEWTVLDHINAMIKLKESAKIEWRQDIVDKLDKEIDKARPLVTAFQNNLLELTDIIIDNQLIWDKAINNYIKENYWMPVTEFMKRWQDGEQLNIWTRSIPDYIINLSTFADMKYSMETDTLSPEMKAYIFASDLIWLWTSWIKTLTSIVTSPFKKWTYRAQVWWLSYMDTIPWFQAWENARRYMWQFRDISDETLALFPWIMKWVVKWWLNVWKLATSIPWLSQYQTIRNIWKWIDTIRDINLFSKWIVNATLKWVWTEAEVNKLWLIESAASNIARSIAKDLYIEWVVRRIDSERWEDWNRQLSLVTFALPYLFYVPWIIKSLWLDGWISNIDIAKTLWTRKTSRTELNQLRKQYRNMSADLFKKYNSFDTKLQKQIKSDLWWWMVMTRAFADEMVLNSTKQWNEFIDFWNYIANDPEWFIKNIGSYMKKWHSADTQKFIDWLKIIVNDPNTNIVDIIKYSYDLPWTISIMWMRSTIPDTAWATKVLADAIRNAASKWQIAPVQFVWWGVDWVLSTYIKNVFGNKFLPSKKFTEWELLKAKDKAKWTPLEWLLSTNTEWKFAMFKKQSDWKYILTKDWLKQLWVIDTPTTDKIIKHIDDEEYEELADYLWRILGRDVTNLTVEWWVIPKLKEFLSSKLCK